MDKMKTCRVDLCAGGGGSIRLPVIDHYWLHVKSWSDLEMPTPNFPKLALALCLAIPFSQADACVYWDPHRASDEGSVSLVADPNNASTSSTSGHNVGVYYYDAITGQSTLTESYYDPSAATWAFNAGHVVQSDASFAGAARPSGSGKDDAIACFGDDEETPTLPTVTVTAFVPFLGGGFFYRILGIGGGGGGGGGVNTIRVAGQANGSSNYTCALAEELRLAEANTHAIAVVMGARRGNDFVMTMPNGQAEHWSYMCGGRFCGPTVLQPSPRVSPCGN